MAVVEAEVVAVEEEEEAGAVDMVAAEVEVMEVEALAAMVERDMAAAEEAGAMEAVAAAVIDGNLLLPPPSPVFASRIFSQICRHSGILY